jgi:hypothetical protein
MSTLLALALAVAASITLNVTSDLGRMILLGIAPTMIVAIAGLTAEGAYGRTAAWHHVYRHQPVLPTVWFWPKLLANAVFALTLAGVLNLLLYPVGLAVFAQAPALTMVFAVAFLAGVLVPYRDDVPFNALLTSAIALIVATAALTGLAKLGGGLLEQVAGTATTVAVALAAARVLSR